MALYLLLTALIAGCGDDSPKRVVEDWTAAIARLNNVLEKVKDDASANAAAPQVLSIAQELRDTLARAKQLPSATAEQQEAAQQAIEKKLKPQNERLLKIVARLRKNRRIKDPKEFTAALREANELLSSQAGPLSEQTQAR